MRIKNRRGTERGQQWLGLGQEQYQTGMRLRVTASGSRALVALQLHSPAWHRPKPPVSPRPLCPTAFRAAPVFLGSLRRVPRCALLPPCALLTAVRSLAVARLPAFPGAGPESSRAGAGGRALRERPGWAQPLLAPQQVSPTFLTARLKGGGAGELWGNHAWESEESTANKLRPIAPPSLPSGPPNPQSVPSVHTLTHLVTSSGPTLHIPFKGH